MCLLGEGGQECSVNKLLKGWNYLKSQLAFDFNCCEVTMEEKVEKKKDIELLDYAEYDHILLSISGGKDSVACLLMLLESGVSKDKIELVHQCIDGKLDTAHDFLDWPVTESYIEALAEHFGLKLSFQWRAQGFYGELLRRERLSNDIYYLENGKVVHLPTQKGKKSTRLMWPAMSSNLSIRYCSAYLKIDVFRKYVNNHPDFKGTIENPKKILVITGERALESPARARYAYSEFHACNTKSRIVHAVRPVLRYTEEEVWALYEKYSLLSHPAYLLGWNRTSCFGCIFSTADLWAMMREIAPERFDRIARMEQELGHTIDASRITVVEKANMGSLKRLPKDKRLSKWVDLALNRSFNKEDLIMDKWELPAGAFRGSEGGPL